MRLSLLLFGLVPILLAAVVAPVRYPCGRHAVGGPRPVLPPPVPEPAPIRQARDIPPPQDRIPDYVTFAEVAEAHSALWEITYRHREVAPYTARHRVTGHVLAVSDVDLLDHCLSVYEPPPPARSYTERGRIRRYTDQGRSYPQAST